MAQNVGLPILRFDERFSSLRVFVPPGTKMESAAQEIETRAVEWMGSRYEARVLLHFDIRAVEETVRRRVDRFLYGAREVRATSAGQRTYRYPGLLERTGGRHYGQSVVILDSSAADEAFYFLRGMKVPCQRIEILAPDWV